MFELEISSMSPAGFASVPRPDRFTLTKGIYNGLDDAVALATRTPVVPQVSRWDALADPLGVIRGFAEHVPDSTGTHPIHGAPAVSTVTGVSAGAQALGEALTLREVFARAVTGLLADRAPASPIVDRAPERGRDQFTSPRSLPAYRGVIHRVLVRAGVPAAA